MSLGLWHNVCFRGLALSTVICLAGCAARVDGPNELSAGVSGPAATPSPAVSSGRATEMRRSLPQPQEARTVA